MRIPGDADPASLESPWRAALAGLPGATATRYVRGARLLEFRDGIIAYRDVGIADDRAVTGRRRGGVA